MAVRASTQMYAVHAIRLNDGHIIRAAARWNPKHKDAPNERELAELRDLINEQIDTAFIDMLSLTWLRNRFVQLRKSGKL